MLFRLFIHANKMNLYKYNIVRESALPPDAKPGCPILRGSLVYRGLPAPFIEKTSLSGENTTARPFSR